MKPNKLIREYKYQNYNFKHKNPNIFFYYGDKYDSQRLRNKKLYEPQLPNLEIVVSKRTKIIERLKFFIKYFLKNIIKFFKK